MQAIRSILVVLEPNQPEGLALKRAKRIAGATQSELHLLVCDRHHDRRPWLDELAHALREEGHVVGTRQDWQESSHQTIIAAQQAEGCGLVIKQHYPDNPLKKALLTPDDCKLLRYCPCPVLLVKTERPWLGGKILAAVDVGNDDREHNDLHADIVCHAHDLASLAKGELHVLSAHPSPILTAADPAFQLREVIAARYREACQRFQDEYGLGNHQLHIAEGPADILIPQLAAQLDAVVAVIGTVARSGLSGALIGNTAEVVLDVLECDVLVLKPDELYAQLEKQLKNLGG